MAGEYVEFHNNAQPALNETNVNLMQQLIKQDIQGAVSGDTLPVGAIIPFGSDTIPENWLLCNGQAVSRTDYQDLYNTIGTTFGQGDGFTTFNLPDLQGKVVVGKDINDTDFDVIGETGGEKEHTLTIDEMPAHRHKQYSRNYNVQPVTSGSVAGNYEAIRSDDTSSTGGDQPHNILQPYQVQNYIIKAKQTAGIVAQVIDGLTSTSQTDALSANQGKILNEKFNYSTTEKQIGTWIDGKPIYRKVFEINMTASSTSVAIDVQNLNIENVIHIEGISQTDPMASNYYWADIDKFRTYYNPINYRLMVQCGSDFPARPFTAYVILEYTKTTD